MVNRLAGTHGFFERGPQTRDKYGPFRLSLTAPGICHLPSLAGGFIRLTLVSDFAGSMSLEMPLALGIFEGNESVWVGPCEQHELRVKFGRSTRSDVFFTEHRNGIAPASARAAVERLRARSAPLLANSAGVMIAHWTTGPVCTPRMRSRVSRPSNGFNPSRLPQTVG